MMCAGRAVCTVLPMELAAKGKLNNTQHYSPTSTPVLDVFRPLPPQTKESLSAGEYFLASSLAILTLVALPSLRAVVEIAPGYWAALIPVIAALSAGFAHEMGHILAGWLSGFRPKQIKIGTLHLGRHARCGEPYCGDVITLGAAVLEPRVSDQDDATLRRRLLFLMLGGPLASILLAGALEIALYVVPAWISLSLSACMWGPHFPALMAIAASLPDVNRRGIFSDGARLLMLLRNDAKAERWLSNIRCQIALNQGRHPRDWDQACVARAAAVSDDSRDAYVARWLAYLWAAERQDITCATKYLEGALEVLSYCHAQDARPSFS